MCETDYFTIRLPRELKPWLLSGAEKHTRSLTAQVTHLLKELKRAEEAPNPPEETPC